MSEWIRGRLNWTAQEQKWVSVAGGGRKVPGGEMGPLEEKCQLQSNYNLLSPLQLQLRFLSLPM